MNRLMIVDLICRLVDRLRNDPQQLPSRIFGKTSFKRRVSTRRVGLAAERGYRKQQMLSLGEYLGILIGCNSRNAGLELSKALSCLAMHGRMPTQETGEARSIDQWLDVSGGP